RMIRTEPTPSARQQARVRQAPLDSPSRTRPSTRRVIHSEAPKRVEVLTVKREQSKFKAPLQFTAIMFGAVIVSVAAFGLLRGEQPAVNPGPPVENAAVETD